MSPEPKLLADTQILALLLPPVVDRLVTSSGRYLFEGFVRVGENDVCPRCRLIAPNDDIDIEWIELDTAAYPTGIFGGNKGLTRSQERDRE